MMRALWALILLASLTDPVSAQDQEEVEAKARAKGLHLNAPAPVSGEAPYRRGLSSLEIGNYAQAILDFTAAIEADPADVFPYLKRAHAYEKSAVADYRKALTLSRDANLAREINAIIKQLHARP